MPGSVDPTTPTEPSSPRHSPRIELPEEDASASPRTDGQTSPGLRNSKGWDGKLRVQRTAVLANPEVLSDPESDDENVLPGEELPADEGKSSLPGALFLRWATSARRGVVRLCLRQNSIQSIDGLAALAPTLEDLDFYDNLISHIRGLDDLVNLTSLDLSFNKIKHIKRVNHLTKLKELFLVANKISTIENLEGLDDLTSLELGSNRIRVLQNLDSLKKLEELWVAKNKITELTGLGGLSNLRLLSIQSNRIRDLAPLAEVPGLEELYISHNALTSLAGIEKSEKLRVLDISNNAVASVKGLAPLKNLEELWASYNQIGDFNEVEKELKDKEHLTTVYFEGNPLQLRGPAVYRNKVRLALPQLSQIDATFVKTS
ncbi:protein phosphatase 1 regulatory subunit SDS22 [Colletotrichum abscissum]|uniref:Protein phosphatase 1 regulatory subunit SDS22 n=1 Tax=Colletotrichum melonis TaxID=1209925 RepID=A0AAI9UBI1_9PEZI|nr:protein phosphatase 1 regulatory subunit SDS22 [Colletotrichum abscissum]KAK1455300.1 protein phosphatase 1 regulatory subunit SDS22 [Colletotrichum melonis]KAK1483796.1 protein phosphatase 1 regulatory subunit SDS22 [Colletotrichum abscissum]